MSNPTRLPEDYRPYLDTRQVEAAIKEFSPEGEVIAYKRVAVGSA